MTKRWSNLTSLKRKRLKRKARNLSKKWASSNKSLRLTPKKWVSSLKNSSLNGLTDWIRGCLNFTIKMKKNSNTLLDKSLQLLILFLALLFSTPSWMRNSRISKDSTRFSEDMRIWSGTLTDWEIVLKRKVNSPKRLSLQWSKKRY